MRFRPFISVSQSSIIRTLHFCPKLRWSLSARAEAGRNSRTPRPAASLEDQSARVGNTEKEGR